MHCRCERERSGVHIGFLLYKQKIKGLFREVSGRGGSLWSSFAHKLAQGSYLGVKVSC